jgi:phosphoenolpyruvate carboxylase
MGQVHEAILAQPPGTVVRPDSFDRTRRGHRNRKYANPEIGWRNLETLVIAATLEAFAAMTKPATQPLRAADELSSASMAATGRWYETPGSPNTFQRHVREIAELNIGRGRRHKPSQQIEDPVGDSLGFSCAAPLDRQALQRHRTVPDQGGTPESRKKRRPRC